MCVIINVNIQSRNSKIGSYVENRWVDYFFINCLHPTQGRNRSLVVFDFLPVDIHLD